MTASIIIAVKDYCANLKECVDSLSELSCRDFEIIILPDNPIDNFLQNNQLKIIPTGSVTPALKRDIGVKNASKEIIAFIDDDAYPCKDWLSSALKLFEDKDTACVCGPAITPAGDNLMQKASGLIYESIMVSGSHNFRYLAKDERLVDDFPSCNFFIRKEIFDKVGGFDTKFWPGEDTFLCLKVKQIGKKMVYHPGVLVYHHRRPVFEKHLLQIRNYAMHRGYFVKKFPGNSLKVTYFIPSLFIVFLVIGALLSYDIFIRYIYFGFISLYLCLVFISSGLGVLKEKIGLSGKFTLFPPVFFGTIFTHLAYGLYFIKGLAAKKMPEE